MKVIALAVVAAASVLFIAAMIIHDPTYTFERPCRHHHGVQQYVGTMGDVQAICKDGVMQNTLMDGHGRLVIMVEHHK